MEKKKLDWIIQIVREDMMTVGSGGYTGAGDPKTKGGFDPVMGLQRRKGPQIKLPPGSRKRWMKPKTK